MAEQDPLNAFISKWGNSPTSSPASEALRNADLQRVKAGKNPLTASQTQRAVIAAQTRQPVTPIPEPDPTAIWTNVTNDITGLVKGIPQLPQALINEALSLGREAPDVEGVGGLLQLPLIRLLPGSYTASALLPGGVPAGDIAIHPVTTALDVLPFATKGLNVLGEGALARLPENLAIPETNLTVGQAPAARQLGTMSSARAVEQFMRENTAPLSMQDRVGLQTALAVGQRERAIPSLLSRKIAVNEAGTGLIDRAWRRRLAESPRMSRVLEMGSNAARSTRSLIARNEANQIIDARRQEAFIAGAKLSEELAGAFDEARVADVYEQLNRAFQDPDSFSTQAGFKIQTPDEARQFLDDDVKPWFDRVDESAQLVREQILGDTPYAGGREAFVRKYDGDGNVYTVEEWGKLTKADEVLYKRQTDLSDRATKILPRIQNSVESRFPGAIEASRLGMQLPSQAARAAEQFLELEKVVTGHIDGNYMPSWNKVSKAALEISANDAPALKKLLDDARDAQRTRANASINIRPATEMRTGSRLFYERAKANYEEAASRAATDPVFQQYRQAYELTRELDPMARVQARRILREQMGDDYHLLRYTVPDTPDFIKFYSDKLERQNLRSLMEPGEAARLQRQINETLYGMSKEGYRPEWLPGVAMEKAANVDSTSVRLTYFQPEYAKRRSFDYAPMNPDLGVNISYASLQDYMSRSSVPYITDEIQKLGVTGAELEKMLQHEAISQADRLSVPNRDQFIADYVNEAMGRGADARRARYIQFDPKKLWPTVADAPTAPLTDSIWLPKEVESIVVKSFKDSNSFFQQLFEPATDLFRVSVLLFAPAWHWNNILSNSFITGLTNPRAFLNLADEWNRMGGWGNFKSTITGAEDAAGGLEASLRGVGQEFSPQMQKVGFEGMLGAIENMTVKISKAKGKMALENAVSRFRTGNRILEEIQTSKAGAATSSAFGKMTGGSLALNSWFDDLFRRANFEAFYDSEFAKLTDEGVWNKTQVEAKAAEYALGQTQDWLMDWSQLLPVERGILRAVFPFYSFMSHIMRAALKYPFDHPTRVAVINAFTRAEIDDWQSRYPQIFRRLLGVPDVDNMDTFTGLNVDSFNPFRDVGNILTLGGMLSATNPLIQFVFKSVGVDPMSGGPEYAPNFVYDINEPMSRAYDSGNPVINLAKDIVPQLEAVSRFFGMDADFRKLEQENPAAANRALLSGLRLPQIYRTVNINEVLAKEEIKRFDDYGKAKRDLDIDRLARYSPEEAQLAKAMAEKQDAVDAAKSGQIEQMAAGGFTLPKNPAALSRMVVDSGGGPPANPLSAFITV